MAAIATTLLQERLGLLPDSEGSEHATRKGVWGSPGQQAVALNNQI